MHQYRFYIRSLLLFVALVAVLLSLRDRLDRRWYSCVARAAHHSQRAEVYVERFGAAKSRRDEELARHYMRVAQLHRMAASRYREAAFKFYLPRPNYPLDGPRIGEEIDLKAEYTNRTPRSGPDPALQRTRPAGASAGDIEASRGGPVR